MSGFLILGDLSFIWLQISWGCEFLGPYCRIRARVRVRVDTCPKWTLSEITVGIQKWSVISSPIVKISHPLSSPTLKFDGKWFIKNTTLETKCELEINFENGEIKKGNLICDDQNYRIEAENDILLINNSPLRLKQHYPIYILK